MEHFAAWADGAKFKACSGVSVSSMTDFSLEHREGQPRSKATPLKGNETQRNPNLSSYVLSEPILREWNLNLH